MASKIESLGSPLETIVPSGPSIMAMGRPKRSINLAISARAICSKQTSATSDKAPVVAAERIAHFFEVHQRRIGVGRGGDGPQQRRSDRSQEMPAPPRGEKANPLLREGQEKSKRLIRVAKAIFGQHLGHALRRGVR